MSEATNAVPNPGSPEAGALGCLCPVMDNARGKGIPTTAGVHFWINADCPVHCGNPPSNNPKGEG